jgi:F0F1-type ATP synthase delta subunit
MKYKTKDYAKALADILSEKKIDEKKISGGFIKLLERQNDLKKSKEIIELAEFLLAKKNNKKLVTFETARKLSEAQRKMLLKSTEVGDIIKEKINPELMAGVKIIVDNEKQLDQTLLKKINSLFKKN